jgi:hypothetical protein
MALPIDAYDVPVRAEWKLMASFRADSPTVTNVAVAQRLGVNVNTVTRWLKDPTYQRYENWVLTKNFEALPLATQQEIKDVSATFRDGAVEMQDRLHRIIESIADPKLEADLCQDWLDRAGFAPQRKVADDGRRPIIMTAEAAEVFFRRAAEAGLLPGSTIDVAPAIDVVVTRAEGS